MRRIQYSGFVEVFNCLTVVLDISFVIMTVRTILKVPFEKAAPRLPFRRFGIPAGKRGKIFRWKRTKHLTSEELQSSFEIKQICVRLKSVNCD